RLPSQRLEDKPLHRGHHHRVEFSTPVSRPTVARVVLNARSDVRLLCNQRLGVKPLHLEAKDRRAHDAYLFGLGRPVGAPARLSSAPGTVCCCCGASDFTLATSGPFAAFPLGRMLSGWIVFSIVGLNARMKPWRKVFRIVASRPIFASPNRPSNGTRVPT